MAEISERPFRRPVTLGAVVAEQTVVPIFGLMARRAVELRLRALKLRCVRRRAGLLRPCDEHIKLLIVRGGGVPDLPHADAREGNVIHLRRAQHTSPVFEMTSSALADLGVKGGRLALKDVFIVGMANDAVLSLNSFDRRVAGRAIILQRRVRLRQLTRHDHVLPKGERDDFTRWLFAVVRVMRGERKEGDDGQGESDGRE